MAGVLAIYGLVVGVIIAQRIQKPPLYSLYRYFSQIDIRLEGNRDVYLQCILSLVRWGLSRRLRFGIRFLYWESRRLRNPLQRFTSADVYDCCSYDWFRYGISHVRSYLRSHTRHKVKSGYC